MSERSEELAARSREFAKGLPRESPWPHFTEREAAKILGVEQTFVGSMANQKNGSLRSMQVRTGQGNPIRVYNKDDVMAVKAKMDAIK